MFEEINAVCNNAKIIKGERGPEVEEWLQTAEELLFTFGLFCSSLCALCSVWLIVFIPFIHSLYI